MAGQPSGRALLLAATLMGCGTADPPPAEALPCDVSAVLVSVCQKCHGSPPADGVPISLVTYDDTRAPYSDGALYRKTPVWKIMGDLVRQGVMPEKPVVLPDADCTTLLDWVDRGAPSAAPSGP